ncbi:MAG TPA: class I SAM-dependent methyltransferase [Candidatus Binatia bacterium]|jgi:SAM-dependent methyltransferase|nr:class I SAM-dependent methyltransferase [Candidatus Binatia bacterium]
MFEVAEAYERQMGRWSRLLAPLFVEFVGVRHGDRVLDAGCGTGSLSVTIARMTKAAEIVGIDASKGFIEYAQAQNSDSRVRIELGDVQNLSYPDASFDRCLSLLVVNHIPNTPKAVREMRRVTKPDGVIATAMWDGTGGNEFNDCLWDAAIALDPTVTPSSQRQGAYSSPPALSSLWEGAGLTDVEVKSLTMPCGYSSFDEFWNRYLEGQGPAGSYVVGLSADRREALRQRLRQNILRDRPDGPFALTAKAWVVKGIASV